MPGLHSRQRYLSRLSRNCEWDEVRTNVDIHTLVRELRERYNFHAWFTFSLRQHETRMRVWRVHSSRLPLSRPVLISSLSSRRHVGKSVPSQRKWECVQCLASLLYLSCSSRTRVWMSTFVRTSSRSHFTKSLDEHPRWECKPGMKPVCNNVWPIYDLSVTHL